MNQNSFATDEAHIPLSLEEKLKKVIKVSSCSLVVLIFATLFAFSGLSDSKESYLADQIMGAARVFGIVSVLFVGMVFFRTKDMLKEKIKTSKVMDARFKLVTAYVSPYGDQTLVEFEDKSVVPYKKSKYSFKDQGIAYILTRTYPDFHEIKLYVRDDFEGFDVLSNTDKASKYKRVLGYIEDSETPVWIRTKKYKNRLTSDPYDL